VRKGSFFHFVDLSSQGLGHSHDDGIASVAIDDHPGFAAGHGVLDCLVDLVGVDVVFGHRLAIRSDFEQRCLAERVEFNVGGAGHFLKDLPHLAGDLFDLRVIVSEDFHCDVGARAFEDFIEPHFNRLREEIGLARHLDAEFGAHAVCQLVLGKVVAFNLWPFLEGFVEDVGIGDVDTHWIGSHFRRADARKGVSNARELLSKHFLCALLHGDGGIKPDARRANHVRGEGTFVELRDKLRTEASEDEQGRDKQCDRASDEKDAESQSQAKDGFVDPL
jgi:hypothetical protein